MRAWTALIDEGEHIGSHTCVGGAEAARHPVKAGKEMCPVQSSRATTSVADLRRSAA